MTVEVKGYGKVTASKAMLNSLSIIFDNAEELYKLKNNPEMAAIMNGAAWDIYNALNEVGYYTDVKYRD